MQADETITHSLVLCPFAAQCLLRIHNGVHMQAPISFATWFDEVGTRMGKEVQNQVVVLYWSFGERVMSWFGKESNRG